MGFKRRVVERRDSKYVSKNLIRRGVERDVSKNRAERHIAADGIDRPGSGKVPGRKRDCDVAARCCNVASINQQIICF